MEILAVHTSYTVALVAIGFIGACICLALAPFFGRSTMNAKVIGSSVIALGTGAILVISTNPSVVTYQAKVDDWNVVYAEGYEVVDIDGDIATLKKVKGKRTNIEIIPPINKCKCETSDDPLRTRRRDDGQLIDEEDDEK